MADLRRMIHFALVILLFCSSARADVCQEWPAWNQFRTAFLSADGRVVDPFWEDKRTVSEGQAYALFFSLAANDRASFDKILKWTEDNLAQGDLTQRLPAWHWGKRPNDSWGVLDTNPASDADLWLAYTLAEAGKVWSDRRLLALSTLLANRILQEESADLSGLGRAILPAPRGFQPDAKTTRLNASYLPIQILRRLAGLYPDSDWKNTLEPALRITLGSAPAGQASDWVTYRIGQGFQPDDETQANGGYDAIRIYLWVGMLDAKDPYAPRLLQAMKPMATIVAELGAPPEKVDTRNGKTGDPGPVGFSAAITPFLQALGETALAQTQAKRVAEFPAADLNNAYYSSSLVTFYDGWNGKRYRFDADGGLQLGWQSACFAR
jgi:endoglucanase